MIEGEVMMFNESGTSKIKAPMMFVGQSGRKMGYILKDTVWLNVYSNPTNERNIDVLESMFLEKSDVWEAKNIKEDNREDDVKDFDLMVLESGFDKETIEKQSKNEGDQIEMNEYFESKASVRDSNIHGIGLFATSSFHKGEMIGPARINGKRTIAGRYVNHAKMPNCIFKKFGNDVFLFANEELKGCHGGDKGTELTVDYRQALELSGIYLKDRG